MAKNQTADARKTPPPPPPRDTDAIEATPYPSTVFDDNKIHNVLALSADVLGPPGSHEREIGLDLLTSYEPQFSVIADYCLQIARFKQDLKRLLPDKPGIIDAFKKTMDVMPKKAEEVLERRSFGRS